MWWLISLMRWTVKNSDEMNTLIIWLKNKGSTSARPRSQGPGALSGTTERQTLHFIFIQPPSLASLVAAIPQWVWSPYWVSRRKRHDWKTKEILQDDFEVQGQELSPTRLEDKSKTIMPFIQIKHNVSKPHLGRESWTMFENYARWWTRELFT